MPVISPSAFAPPAANDKAAPVSADLREKVRRLERAHSVQRAGKTAVSTGLPALDALLPEGGLLTGALHEIEAGPAPSGRFAAQMAPLWVRCHLLGRFAAGTILWCRQPMGVFDAPPMRQPCQPGSIRRACWRSRCAARRIFRDGGRLCPRIAVWGDARRRPRAAGLARRREERRAGFAAARACATSKCA